jgi:hypothetical protein
MQLDSYVRALHGHCAELGELIASEGLYEVRASISDGENPWIKAIREHREAFIEYLAMTPSARR